MKLVLLGALLLFWTTFVEANDGREFGVKAVDFRLKWNKYLELGDCVDVYAKNPGNVPMTPGLKFTGETVFVENKRSDLSYNRLQTFLDSHKRTMGGLSVGIDLLGIIGTEVEGKVTVTTKVKRNTVNMEAVLHVRRGMDQLMYATPNDLVLRQSDNCPFYLSEILYGGTERLLVQFEFETKYKKVEIEYKVTVKVLFFKISVKMRFVTTTTTGGGRCTVIQISTYQDNVEKVFKTETFPKERFLDAIYAVEAAESQLNGLPNNLNGKTMTQVRSQLHLMYYFSKAIIGNVYKASVASNQWAYQQARMQFVELDNTLRDITDELAGRALGLGGTTLNELTSLKQTVSSVKTSLGDKLLRFYELSSHELRTLNTVYGTDKAPGYYYRKFRKILPEQSFEVCSDKTLSTSGASVTKAEGVTLAECGDACKAFNGNRGCKMYTFKPSGSGRGRCTVFDGSACPTSSSESGSTLVLTELASCSSLQLGVTGCINQSFVD